MEKELLLESAGGQTRLAVIEDGNLCEYYIERQGCEKLVGNIYMGQVVNVLPGMQAAFVDIGYEKNGFLYAGDIQLDKRVLGSDATALEKALSELSIRKLVQPGQHVPVQVVKEPVGVKGPRLSENITLPGHLVVLLPTLSYVGISRRIESDAERQRLRQLAESLRPEGMGLIVRTAAEGAGEEMLRQDIEYLVRLWNSIRQYARHTTAPALLHRDVSLINRSIRDMLLPEISAFKVQGDEAYEQVFQQAKLLSDEMAGKVIYYQDSHPLFDLYRVDAQMEQAIKRKVWLKSGGYLVFDYTEALTVIDVNTGKFVGKKSLSDTIFKINCEAVIEIARQIRLRDIGGIIIVDFIDMEATEHREALLQLMRRELKRDRTKTNLVGLTGLGLVEMTRKKVHQPIHTLIQEICPVCQGSGRVLTYESIAYNALSQLRALAQGEGAWLIHAHPEVAGQLLLIGAPKSVKAYVRPDAQRKREDFELTPVLEHNLPPKSRPLPPQ